MVISSPCNTDCVVIGSDEVVNSSEIANIDQDSDKLLGVSEYAEDIYKYLRQAEVSSFFFVDLPWPAFFQYSFSLNQWRTLCQIFLGKPIVLIRLCHILKLFFNKRPLSFNNNHCLPKYLGR